jgi:hypothetical protein
MSVLERDSSEVSRSDLLDDSPFALNVGADFLDNDTGSTMAVSTTPEIFVAAVGASKARLLVVTAEAAKVPSVVPLPLPPPLTNDDFSTESAQTPEVSYFSDTNVTGGGATALTRTPSNLALAKNTQANDKPSPLKYQLNVPVLDYAEAKKSWDDEDYYEYDNPESERLETLLSEAREFMRIQEADNVSVSDAVAAGDEGNSRAGSGIAVKETELSSSIQGNPPEEYDGEDEEEGNDEEAEDDDETQKAVGCAEMGVHYDDDEIESEPQPLNGSQANDDFSV